MDDAERPPADAQKRRPELALADYRFNWGVAQGGLPVLVFWVANNLASTQIALLLAFVTAVVVIVRNRDSGVIRALSLLGFAIVAAAAVAGLILESDKAFAAQNIASDFALVLIGLGSLALRRPIIGVIAREMIPALRPRLPEIDRVFIVLTVGFVLLNLVQAVVRIYMLDAFSANTYIVVSRVFAFPLNVAFIAVAWTLVSRRVAGTRHQRPRPGEAPA